MRTVAQYVFEGATSRADQADTLHEAAKNAVSAWLSSKGASEDGPANITYPDGRCAQYSTTHTTCKSGTVSKWFLEETGQSRFSTTLALAKSGSELVFSCTLATGSTGAAIAPSTYTARCPRLIKDLLQISPGWRVGTTGVPFTAIKFAGEAQAPDLVMRLLCPERALPIVLASRYDGFLLHPKLIDLLASDLCGLAIVADVDDRAAWAMTHQLGKEWSCYNGAIRIYWPHLDTNQPPRRHPLWTSERLMYHAADTEFASRRIRDIIRRRLFSVSCFALEQPELIERLQDETAAEARQEKLTLATNADDYKRFAEEYAQENDKLHLLLRQERENIKQLRQDLYQAQLTKEWADADEAVAPDEATPPDSVEDAVAQARRAYAQQLTFGEDVARGINTLAPNAGPPQKILGYLRILASMVDKRRDGDMGDTMIQWLKNNGAVASDESQTVQKNRTEMQRRTWHDGRAERKFQLHMKPKEGTSPDHCVRIYFDWDEPSAKAVVGWVGRHP